jgi:hypothetical protein
MQHGSVHSGPQLAHRGLEQHPRHAGFSQHWLDLPRQQGAWQFSSQPPRQQGSLQTGAARRAVDRRTAYAWAGLAAVNADL